MIPAVVPPISVIQSSILISAFIIEDAEDITPNMRQALNDGLDALSHEKETELVAAYKHVIKSALTYSKAMDQLERSQAEQALIDLGDMLTQHKK